MTSSGMAQHAPSAIDEQILYLIGNESTQERGYRLLVQHYQERLYWHIRRMVIHHEDANDVVQNVFVKVFRGIGNFKGESKLYTWLYKIATNESISFLEQQRRKASDSIDDELTLLGNRLQADDYFEGEAIELLLQQAIATLPDKQRAVFNMRYFDEMSYESMGEVTGTSVGALKASFHHALKKVEHFLLQRHDL